MMQITDQGHRWRPWATVPKDGRLVVAMMSDGSVWVARWAPDDAPLADDAVGSFHDNYVVAWMPRPDDEALNTAQEPK